MLTGSLMHESMRMQATGPVDGHAPQLCRELSLLSFIVRDQLTRLRGRSVCAGGAAGEAQHNAGGVHGG